MPKLVPAIVTDVFTVPDVGDRFVMLGIGSTVNAEPGLATPLTVTITFPLVAAAGTAVVIDVGLQLIAVAVAPFKATVLVP